VSELNLKDTDYFSFSEIYSGVDKPDQEPQARSKSSDVSADPAPSRALSKDPSAESITTQTSAREEPAPVPKQQPPPVKTAPPAKKTGFFGMFGSKSKSDVVSFLSSHA
jgi:hypothetical protein